LGHQVAKNVDIGGESVPKRSKEDRCETRWATKKKIHIFYVRAFDRSIAWPPLVTIKNYGRGKGGGRRGMLRGWTGWSKYILCTIYIYILEGRGCGEGIVAGGR
jgi:hypothetical protein